MTDRRREAGGGKRKADGRKRDADTGISGLPTANRQLPTASRVLPPASRLRAYVELSRPVNGAMSLLGVFVGAALGVRGQDARWTTDALWNTVAVGLATVLILSAGNALNDACDAAIDRVNRPRRPIPSGRLTARNAVMFAVGAAFCGVLVAVLVGWMETALAVGAAGLLALYALVLKGTPLGGNLVIGALSAAAVVAGGVAVGGMRYSLVPAFFVLVFTVTRELVKDIEDVEGDARHGARTAAVVWGMRPALILATVCCVIGVAFSPLPCVLEWRGFGIRYLILVLVGVDAVMLTALWRLWMRLDAATAHRAQGWMKVGAFMGLVAVYLG